MAKTNGTATPPVRKRVQVDCSEGGRTHVSFKDECDINRIMARHRKTGLVRQRTERPQYGDFSNVGDYQEAMNTVLNAENMFAELGSDVRQRFHNNPQEFLDFCDNPDNQDEAVELGIAAPPLEGESTQGAEPTVEELSEGNPIIGGE